MTIAYRLSSSLALILLTTVLEPIVSAADSAAPDETLPRISLDFPGGTLAEFTEALEKAHGRPINLVLPGNTDLPMPAVRVTNVSLNQILSAVSMADSSIGFRDVRSGPGDEPVWVVELKAQASERQYAHTFSVEPLLEKYNINDLTTAIQTAWTMARAGDAASGPGFPGAPRTHRADPELKFHQETKLLIVRGTGEDLEIAKNVIEQLSPKSPSSHSPEELANLRANRLSLLADRAAIEAELDQLERAHPESGQIPALKLRLSALNARISTFDNAVNAQPK